MCIDKKMGPFTISPAFCVMQGQNINIFSMRHALGIRGHAEALDNNRNFNKRRQQCGRKRRFDARTARPKRERQRARRREPLVGASERTRGRGEAQFLGIFTTSSW